ncbi:DUF1844 domain-containing protein [Occallatibacter riparius]|uniref:DUF1844 domain-containing protein n=1 Tax=Occallatibacter riparius TaxID=1002689 RepID=A0A9J7BQG5_9BACT|nr:DUF1844 domain-containing protein [Occallatibacter riparius]UWZ84928.1 DUF1844 domain-containing protein [Occallatibacter riparius]
MTDTPKFEVIDRRKYKADEEERESASQSAQPEPPTPPADAPKAPPASEKTAGPRLVTSEPAEQTSPAAAPDDDEFAGAGPQMPPPPSPEESQEQKTAYDGASQRLEDIVRAQNPGAGPQPPVTLEHLIQQLYLSSMIQMGAGTQEGQRPRVDILGAKQTIDLLGILQEKTKGNLSDSEARMLDTVLFEARMAFLELTSMISMPGVGTPPPPPPKR